MSSRSKHRDKPPISRQLRPLLLRLKRMTDWGLKGAPANVIECLDLKPRKPWSQSRQFMMWRDARIARIDRTFDVHLHWDNAFGSSGFSLMIFVRPHILISDENALRVLTEVFGSAHPEWSKSGKGWWTDYTSIVDPRSKVILIFDAPSKKQTETTFSAALIEWHKKEPWG
jgi:hypothetical protein